MKKLYIRIIAFFALFLGIDITVGVSGDYFTTIAKGGDTRLHHYVNDEMVCNALFMGSSRCMHHYIPSVFEDSLGVSCFNCGTDGMGIPFMYARYKLITQRYKPQFIFYDVYPAYDIVSIPQFPNSRNLRWLKRYYYREGVKEVFDDIEPDSYKKLWLNMYRYNGTYHETIMDCIKPSRDYSKGFSPLKGEIPNNYILKENIQYPVDSLKMKYWKKFFEETKKDGVKVVLLFSPMWGQTDNSIYEPLMTIADDFGIPIIDHYADEYYNNHRELFSEPYHLNGLGAEYYSKIVSAELRPFLKEI